MIIPHYSARTLVLIKKILWDMVQDERGLITKPKIMWELVVPEIRVNNVHIYIITENLRNYYSMLHRRIYEEHTTYIELLINKSISITMFTIWNQLFAVIDL
ncbi:hypothetical protein ACJX0J_011875 [Zea mays]